MQVQYQVRMQVTDILNFAINIKEQERGFAKTVLKVLLDSYDKLTDNLSEYGECPSKEYIVRELSQEDFGEFTVDEMHEMVAACYL